MLPQESLTPGGGSCCHWTGGTGDRCSRPVTRVTPQATDREGEGQHTQSKKPVAARPASIYAGSRAERACDRLGQDSIGCCAGHGTRPVWRRPMAEASQGFMRQSPLQQSITLSGLSLPWWTYILFLEGSSIYCPLVSQSWAAVKGMMGAGVILLESSQSHSTLPLRPQTDSASYATTWLLRDFCISG
jgi:hypothetical protein